MKPLDEQRRVAKRLWDGGMPRRRIAVIVGISEHTLKSWRYEYGWSPRSGYKDRPVLELPAKPKLPKPIPVVRDPIHACPFCGMRCVLAEGHETCQGVAA